MKKRLFWALGTCMAALFALSACSAPTPTSSLTASVWMTNRQEVEGGWAEILEYDVRLDPEYAYSGFDNIRLAAAPDDFQPEITSSYTSEIRWDKPDPDEFVIHTRLVFKGQWTDNDGNPIGEPFVDEQESSVTISNVTTASLAPISSVKTFVNTVPFSSSEGLTTKQYRFRTEIEYDRAGNKAISRLNRWNEDEQEFNLPMPMVTRMEQASGNRPQETGYKKLTKQTPYYDNDQMFYAARAMTQIAKREAYTTTFSVIDALNPAKNSFVKISLSMSAADKTDSFILQLPDYLVNGQAVNKEAARVFFSKSGSQGGKPIAVFYSTLAEQSSGSEKMTKLPLRIVQEQMIYDLQKVNGSYVTGDPQKEESGE